MGAMKSETEQRLAREKSEMTAARKKLEEEIRLTQRADAHVRRRDHAVAREDRMTERARRLEAVPSERAADSNEVATVHRRA